MAAHDGSWPLMTGGRLMAGSAEYLTRRTFLRATAASTAVSATAVTALGSPALAAPAGSSGTQRLFRELDAKIQDGMARYAIPGSGRGRAVPGRRVRQGIRRHQRRLPGAGRWRHRVPDRLDHQDVHRDCRDAPGRGGAAEAGRPGASVPAGLSHLGSRCGAAGDRRDSCSTTQPAGWGTTWRTPGRGTTRRPGTSRGSPACRS